MNKKHNSVLSINTKVRGPRKSRLDPGSSSMQDYQHTPLNCPNQASPMKKHKQSDSRVSSKFISPRNAFITGIETDHYQNDVRFSGVNADSMDRLPDNVFNMLNKLPKGGMSTDGVTYHRYNYMHPSVLTEARANDNLQCPSARNPGSTNGFDIVSSRNAAISKPQKFPSISNYDDNEQYSTRSLNNMYSTRNQYYDPDYNQGYDSNIQDDRISMDSRYQSMVESGDVSGFRELLIKKFKAKERREQGLPENSSIDEEQLNEEQVNEEPESTEHEKSIGKFDSYNKGSESKINLQSKFNASQATGDPYNKKRVIPSQNMLSQRSMNDRNNISNVSSQKKINDGIAREGKYNNYNETDIRHENSIPIERNFDSKLSANGKLFGGAFKSNYDKFLMKDDIMQKIVLRDQQLIMMDKLTVMKNNVVLDPNALKSIIKFHGDIELCKLNNKFEKIIGILDKLVKQLLFDIIDCFNEIGLEDSPLTSAEVHQKFNSEGETLKGNCKLFGKIVDYFKDAMECFFVLCRQKSKRSFDVATSMKILNLIELVRYEVGLICETSRISKCDGDILHKFEKNKKATIIMPKLMKNKMMNSQSEADLKSSRQKTETVYNINELQQLKVRDKLRILHKNKLKRLDIINPTRESKLNLKFKTSDGILNFNPFEKSNQNDYLREMLSDRKHLVTKGNTQKEIKFKNSELEKKLDMLSKGDDDKSGMYEKVQDASQFVIDNF